MGEPLDPELQAAVTRSAAIRQLARMFYLCYCDSKGTFPYKGTYVPAWAEDYALIAVAMLGLSDDAVRHLVTGDAVAVPA